MFYTFKDLAESVRAQFLEAPLVKPSHWQGKKVQGKPDMETFEILNHTSRLWLPDENLQLYREDIEPDLPWADDHFEERVCGYPLNPGTQWKLWRLGQGAKDSLDPDGRFNHNYMERFWPKFARQVPSADKIPSGQELLSTTTSLKPHQGILYEYGDLLDVVKLLAREPLTRQAFIPMFFPEDTGAVHRGRAPCSLGWHLINRDDQLHCVYYLRSCDVTNHWRNDIYMAIRLIIWVLERLRGLDGYWNDVGPGTLTTHITSFHCFRGEFVKLTRIQR